MDTPLFTLSVGIGATALLDLWGLARRPLLGMPVPDYAPLGRWIAHMRHGRFRHASIAKAGAVPGERVIGWTAHYATGIAFAALLLAIGGQEWMRTPTPGLALAFGAATVAAPFLLMQPCMGAGIAGARTPKPNATRLQSVITHVVFGLALYVAAVLTRSFTNL